MFVNARPLQERRAIMVSGLVQGVGFRPFVFRLALEHKLGGRVKNQLGGVRIEIEGQSDNLDRFIADLTLRPPPLARIEDLRIEPQPVAGETIFAIVGSDGDVQPEDFISPDIATCADCLTEIFDPLNRRYLYPFTNCTNCGPRLTIIRAVPYDRERTTMASFAMCDTCRAEYEDPSNRRFHAEPIACPVCGPQVAVLDREGNQIETIGSLAAIEWSAEQLRAGHIGAMKGLGGFHLMCDGTNPVAVNELRRRKLRDEKPFAVMLADLAEAQRFCEIGGEEKQLLLSPQRPIVLLRRHAACPIAEPVAPGNPWLGVMLPYTPLHHLLLRKFAEPAALVMTSGNRSDAPIVYDDSRLLTELKEVADFFLTHDRRIQTRCDDSVMRIIDGEPLPVRRSRGYAPLPVRLAWGKASGTPIRLTVPTLALGGQMKATFALGRGMNAILSHHIGDLDHFEAYRSYTESIESFERLYRFKPELLVHDLHPDYISSSYARERAAREGLRCLAVQHHHAHVAGCMMENGIDGPVIGVAFDGTGYGDDGAVWGGEFLIAHGASFKRVAHLRYVPMPGGEMAIREPWRMTLAHLLDAGEDHDPFIATIPAPTVATIKQMIAAGINAPLTSSCGRLFDAVAALIGVRREVSYEGQAAIELEWLAARANPSPANGAGEREAGFTYPFGITGSEGEGSEDAVRLIIDTRPLIAAIAREVRDRVAKNRIAQRFHSTIAAIIVKVSCELHARMGLNRVVLSGGVFMNSVLIREVRESLREAGLNVYCHTRVPPNDGGLCLGQLAVAAAQGVHV
jgi:hydrogenase maturation protein HypF